MNIFNNTILPFIINDLNEIEIEIKKNLTPYIDVVSKIAGHILFSKGKRFRPLLMVLCSRICGYNGNYDKKFSTIFEYLHTASLLHDDIVDGARMRRGVTAAHLKWDPSIVTLTGDFLLATALSIVAETQSLEIVDIIAQATKNMSQGEIYQILNKKNINLSEEEYFQLIANKTALLISSACYTGAIIAKNSKEKELALKSYGYNIGMAFQITDDLLDYTADEKIFGKEVGTDLKEGKITLPIIYVLKHAEKNDYLTIQNTLNDNSCKFEVINKMLKKYDGIEYAKRIANEYSLKAKDDLSIFDESPTKEILIKLTEIVINREV